MPVDISVIIPTFRRPAQLVEAIHSALSQSFVRVEVIVIDDSPEGSARSTVEHLNDARIRYVQRAQPSGGRPAIVRNAAFHLARGRYIHFLDDDDRLAPGAAAALVQALDQHSEAGVAFGWVVPFGDDPVALKERADWFTRAARIARASPSRYRTVATILFKGTLMVNSACMIRRELFGKLGGYDPTIQVYEDVDFWMRAIRKFGHVFVDRPVLQYRTGAASIIHDLKGDWRPVEESYKRIQRKYRQEHGLIEYTALHMLAQFIPAVAPRPR